MPNYENNIFEYIEMGLDYNDYINDDILFMEFLFTSDFDYIHL